MKKNPLFLRVLFLKSRSDVIRTRDLYVPNVALYQAEPHSEGMYFVRMPCLSRHPAPLPRNYG